VHAADRLYLSLLDGCRRRVVLDAQKIHPHRRRVVIDDRLVALDDVLGPRAAGTNALAELIVRAGARVLDWFRDSSNRRLRPLQYRAGIL